MTHDPAFLKRLEQLASLARELRDDNLRQTACVRELLCGEWERADAGVSFRIYKEAKSYRIESRLKNTVNGHVRTFTSELQEDAAGNLCFGVLETTVSYYAERDRLLTEDFGIFERKKQPST